MSTFFECKSGISWALQVQNIFHKYDFLWVTQGFLFDSFHNQTFLGYINNSDIQHFKMADAKDVDKKTLLFVLADATTTKEK